MGRREATATDSVGPATATYLDEVRAWVLRHGVYPTTRELAAHLGHRSPTWVVQVFRKLVEAGDMARVEGDPSAARSYRLTGWRLEAVREPDRSKLTDRQREMLGVIYDVYDRDQRPASLRELGDALGITSTNGVLSLIRPLVRKGFLEPAGRYCGRRNMVAKFRVLDAATGAEVQGPTAPADRPETGGT